jgi:hypothetical protein
MLSAIYPIAAFGLCLALVIVPRIIQRRREREPASMDNPYGRRPAKPPVTVRIIPPEV